jgi:DNA-binding NarL/FixJ family response regulator
MSAEAKREQIDLRLRFLGQNPTNHALFDIFMPAGSGFVVAERVQNLVPKLMPIIFLAASQQPGLRAPAERLVFLKSPIRAEEFLAAIHAALGETASLVPG